MSCSIFPANKQTIFIEVEMNELLKLPFAIFSVVISFPSPSFFFPFKCKVFVTSTLDAERPFWSTSVETANKSESVGLLCSLGVMNVSIRTENGPESLRRNEYSNATKKKKNEKMKKKTEKREKEKEKTMKFNLFFAAIHRTGLPLK
jgi:hypothetical protein